MLDVVNGSLAKKINFHCGLLVRILQLNHFTMAIVMEILYIIWHFYVILFNLSYYLIAQWKLNFAIAHLRNLFGIKNEFFLLAQHFWKWILSYVYNNFLNFYFNFPKEIYARNLKLNFYKIKIFIMPLFLASRKEHMEVVLLHFVKRHRRYIRIRRCYKIFTSMRKIM